MFYIIILLSVDLHPQTQDSSTYNQDKYLPLLQVFHGEEAFCLVKRRESIRRFL